MTDFISILENTVVASTNTSITITDRFKNISGSELLHKLRQLPNGNKDGGHFIRAALKMSDNGQCMPRGDTNTHSLADVLVIDCDKHINADGQEIEGAPDPIVIHQALKEIGIGHIIYGSYSHYTGTKGNRYRIILVTNQPYNKEQLPITIEACILLINQFAKDHMLAYAKENNVFAQGWYYPRCPNNNTFNHLYLEYLDGKPVSVAMVNPLPPTNHISNPKQQYSNSKTSPIQAFNQQNQLTDLLAQYGYKRKLITSAYEKWLSPESSSGIAGITVKDNKFFSHHNDQFNDGYWHDAFDLMRIREGLSERDAIIKVSRETTAFNGRSVNQHNKRILNKPRNCIKPMPLPESRPSVLPLQPEMLPEGIRDYVFDVANRQQSFPDFVAVAAIIGLAGLLGRKALIYPKQHDDWAVTPNQWGAIIGRPSAMKSPSMKEALKPLREFESKAAQKFVEDIKNYEEEKILIKLEQTVAENKAKKALKSDNRQEAKEA